MNTGLVIGQRIHEQSFHTVMNERDNLSAFSQEVFRSCLQGNQHGFDIHGGFVELQTQPQHS